MVYTYIYAVVQCTLIRALESIFSFRFMKKTEMTYTVQQAMGQLSALFDYQARVHLPIFKE